MNAASRLLRIYDRLMQQTAEQSTLNAWAGAFDVALDRPHLEDEVTTLLMGLRSEVNFARARLDAHGVPTGLTSPSFERMSQYASPGHIHSPWKNHVGNLHTPDVRKILEWAAWALREEDEADMSAEELTVLEGELAALEAALGETDMAPYLRDFVRKQVETIRGALRMYGVQGVKPVQDALQKVAGAYKTQEKVIEKTVAAAPEEAKGLFAKAAGVIEKVAKVSDNLSKIKKGGEEAYAIGTAVSAVLLPYLPKLLGA
ncbi:hypothetical protein ACG04Q_20760 [Roseateles sp. DXS20W]|uniref:AbiTii domain-containing protein n=1 Tax=Pelomonas lactea TaxID=3299030 RepID=A0ABW7GPW5_9BURK